MKTSIWTRFTITALAGCMVAALAAPAWGQGDDLTLRRDGSKAVPFVADLGGQPGASSKGIVLRRVGSAAEPFVADLRSERPATADGFDLLDAAIGAGVVLLAMGGTRALRSRGRDVSHAMKAGSAASA